MIENLQRIKTFWVYLKALLENYFKLLLFFLKNFFEKDQVPKYYFPLLYSNLCKLACKGVNLKCVLFSKDCILKTEFERWFQTLFYKALFLISKDFIFKPYFYFCYASKVLLPIHKVLLEKSRFIFEKKHVSYCPSLIPWILEKFTSCLNLFGAKMQKL
jgi:hypothetical protein